MTGPTALNAAAPHAAGQAGARPATTPPPDAQLPVRPPEAPAPGALLGPHYDHCFGCGPQQPHGLHLEARAGEGLEVTAEFRVKPVHQGAPGLAHGGVLVSAMDEALGALNWILHTAAVTGRLETDFVRPVPVDSVLYIHARVTGVHGRKIYGVAEGRLEGAEGPVAVRAQALFIEVQPEHFTTHGRPEDIKAVLENPDVLKRTRAFEVNP